MFVFIPTAEVRLGGDDWEDCREGEDGVEVCREGRHTNRLESMMAPTNKTLYYPRVKQLKGFSKKDTYDINLKATAACRLHLLFTRISKVSLREDKTKFSK